MQSYQPTPELPNPPGLACGLCEVVRITNTRDPDDAAGLTVQTTWRECGAITKVSTNFRAAPKVEQVFGCQRQAAGGPEPSRLEPAPVSPVVVLPPRRHEAARRHATAAELDAALNETLASIRATLNMMAAQLDYAEGIVRDRRVAPVAP